MWWLQILQRGKRAQTERVNIVVTTTVENVTACACEREYILGLLTLVDRAILCLAQVVNKKSARLA